VSLDPGMTLGRTPPEAETTGRPASSVTAAAWPPPLDVTRVEVLPLREGDRLIVHVDGAAGLSGGGGQAIGEYIRATLKLDELPFDVPVLVVSPGIRVEVARPA
jgi:hypothetical protein